MNKNVIDEAIFQKYIKPTMAERKRSMGIEIEMPIVNLNKAPVEESEIFRMSAEFREKFGFEATGYDDFGNVNSMTHRESGDNLSFDCSYSNLELSFGKGENLFEIKERFDRYYLGINEIFSRCNYTLTGMGINPYYNINHNAPIPNERYRMLYRYLQSYRRHEGKRKAFVFHNRPDFGTFTSASQVQIDVEYENVVDIINTFGMLEPYKALLFSNSYMPENPELLCSRNMLWEHSMQGYNPHNIGMYGYELKNVGDLVEYIKSTSIYCTMRNGKYVDFTPVPVNEYFQLKTVKGEYFDGENCREIEITPQLEDLKYLRTFKFEDLTFRGTVEFRSSCCQPVSDSMTVAGFHMGLLESFQQLKKLLNSDSVIYSHGYSSTELQKLFSCRQLPAFVDKTRLSEQLSKILDIAKSGLESRGLGEEKLLEPLYERAKALTNPARKIAEGLERGEPIERYISEYARI